MWPLYRLSDKEILDAREAQSTLERLGLHDNELTQELDAEYEKREL